jgi:hypothetical protein
LVVVFVVGNAGCRTRPLDPTDGGVDGGGVRDFGAPIDLAGVCAAHQRRPMPLAGLMPQDPTFNLRTDRAVRVAVTLQLRACDEPGGIDVAISPGNATDFVSITAYRWEGTGPACNGPQVTIVRGVVIGEERILTNPRIVVRDTQNGVGQLMLMPAAAQPGSCVGVADGAPCERDCQCLTTNAQARCIPTATGARCGVPCGTDADCPASQPDCFNRSDGRARVCGPRVQCCDELDDCGKPLFCERCFCLAPNPAPPFSTGCKCDSDCPRDTICDAGRNRCVLTCETEAQCPDWAVACSAGECAFGE